MSIQRLQITNIKSHNLESESCVSLFVTPWTVSMELSWQNTGVGSLSLMQGIFPMQGSNPELLHCKQILYQLIYKGTPSSCEYWSG